MQAGSAGHIYRSAFLLPFGWARPRLICSWAIAVDSVILASGQTSLRAMAWRPCVTQTPASCTAGGRFTALSGRVVPGRAAVAASWTAPPERLRRARRGHTSRPSGRVESQCDRLNRRGGRPPNGSSTITAQPPLPGSIRQNRRRPSGAPCFLRRSPLPLSQQRGAAVSRVLGDRAETACAGAATAATALSGDRQTAASFVCIRTAGQRRGRAGRHEPHSRRSHPPPASPLARRSPSVQTAPRA